MYRIYDHLTGLWFCAFGCGWASKPSNWASNESDAWTTTDEFCANMICVQLRARGHEPIAVCVGTDDYTMYAEHANVVDPCDDAHHI